MLDNLDEIYAEIDRRQAVTLNMRELAHAPIVFVCECGLSQNVNNTMCEECGKLL